MPSLQLTDLEQSDYRDESGRQVGITVTPKKEWCVSCETMRTESTGTHTEKGFVCGCCLDGLMKLARSQPRMKNASPLVAVEGRAGCFGKQGEV